MINFGATGLSKIVTTNQNINEYVEENSNHNLFDVVKIDLNHVLGSGTYGSTYLVQNVKNIVMKTVILTEYVEMGWLAEEYPMIKHFISKGDISLSEIASVVGCSVGLLERINPKMKSHTLNPNSNIEIPKKKLGDCEDLDDRKFGGYPDKEMSGLFCNENPIAEYIIGDMCNEIHNSFCINFPKFHGTSILKIGGCFFGYSFLEKLTPIPQKEVKTFKSLDNIIIQIICAVCALQSMGIMHNDLKSDNIMFKRLSKDDTYNGQSFQKKLSWKIGKKFVTVPNLGFIVKVIDFGLSAKYTHGLVMDKELVDEPFDRVFGFFSPISDVLYFLKEFVVGQQTNLTEMLRNKLPEIVLSDDYEGEKIPEILSEFPEEYDDIYNPFAIVNDVFAKLGYVTDYLPSESILVGNIPMVDYSKLKKSIPVVEVPVVRKSPPRMTTHNNSKL